MVLRKGPERKDKSMKNQMPNSTPAAGASAAPATMRVLLCDDQRLVRTCVREILEATTTVEVVGEAAGGRPAVEMALELKPDVVLMDVSMPDLDGVEATRRILASSPNTRVLAFSADSNAETVERMFAAGARGYLIKSGKPSELMVALRAIHAGERFISAATDSPSSKPRRD
jgi:two-component system, NarL family, response regulator NreC